MLRESFFSINNTSITLLRIVVFFLIVFGTYLGARLIKYGITHAKSTKHSLDTTLQNSLAQLAYFGFMTLGFYLALNIVGIDLTGIAVIAGAFSVGVGMGFQSFFSNFVAGLILLSEKKVKLGDFIELCEGEKGFVSQIHLRHTVIKTLDCHHFLVPNTDMVSKKVKNWNLHEENLNDFCLLFSVDRTIEKKKIQLIGEKFIGNQDLRNAKLIFSHFDQKNNYFKIVIFVKEAKDVRFNHEERASCLQALESFFFKQDVKILDAEILN